MRTAALLSWAAGPCQPDAIASTCTQPCSHEARCCLPRALPEGQPSPNPPAGSADNESLDGLLLMDSGLMVRGEPAAAEPGPGERRRTRDGPAVVV